MNCDDAGFMSQIGICDTGRNKRFNLQAKTVERVQSTQCGVKENMERRDSKGGFARIQRCQKPLLRAVEQGHAC